ncbi:MAG TPA: serine hydrolase [Candidatus Acidoferrum sp.]|nr:serine hydrolase [Candidatus Acidoferrum sp.]
MHLSGQTATQKHFSRCVLVVSLLSTLLGFGRARAQLVTPPRSDYADVVAVLKPFIEQQMADKQLPGLSIAIIDDQQMVWASGFGFADPKAKIPATAETVYRIGSVSKLFTDIGIMQLVERGELNLDAPIITYLPDFHPKNPFGTPITLRELMSHQSGLLREPPVGNYFETNEPSLTQTVQSLHETELVYAPGTHVKYSNAAIAVVGYVLEKKSGSPFGKYLKGAVLLPFGMQHSSFEPEPGLIRDVAKAQMWTYDGRVFDAPTFQLGMAPAGSMYSTVNDLGQFVSSLLAGGRGKNRQVLKPETLESMWKPQSPLSAEAGFGLGFQLEEFNQHRMIGHGGAIYGFATSLKMLPDDKLGVVVVATKDVANAVTDRIAEEALRLILDRRQGKLLALPPATAPVPPDLGRTLAGRYGEGEDGIDLTYLNGALTAARSHQVEVRQIGNELILDGMLGYGTRIVPLENAIRIGEKTFQRVSVNKPPPIPEKWKGLVGEYGWDHDILYVFEKGGRLCVLIEWIEYDSLTEISGDAFAFPKRGLYDGEKAVFTRDGHGEATQVRVSGVIFKRRPIGGVTGGVFRIQPVKNIPDLRKEALTDHPPAETGNLLEPDLVDVTSLDPTIKLDVRYASSNNFLGTPVYNSARAFLQHPAAEALAAVSRSLHKSGYGLLVHDAYRPWYVTKMFWEATPDDKRIFVADPSQGSRHNRGCAVDLSLYDLATGKPIEMVGVYDEMSERSYAGYPGGTSLQRWQRDLLRSAMEQEGFDVYEFEWWHFDYKDWRKYPILNLDFDQIRSAQPQGAHQ